MSLLKRGHLPPPDPAEPGIFSLADPEKVRSLLERAGLEAIETEQVPVRFAFSDLDNVLRVASDTAGPIAMALRSLTEEENLEVRSDLEKALGAFARESGYELPGVALCARAVRP